MDAILSGKVEVTHRTAELLSKVLLDASVAKYM